MADRFEICEAYWLLECDYNVDGWLRERPSNQRRMESIGVQLHRMKFKPSPLISFESMTDAGKEVYFYNVVRWGLPIDGGQRAAINEFFGRSPEEMRTEMGLPIPAHWRQDSPRG